MPTLKEFHVVSCDCDTTVWYWLEFSRRIVDLGPIAPVHVMDEDLPESAGPVPFKIWRGRRPPLVWGNTAHVVLWSRRLLDALDEAGCTGLHWAPAVIYDRSDERATEDRVAYVKPRRDAGPQDWTRGAPLIETDLWRKDPLLKDAVGLYFDTATWGGLDVFRLANNSAAILSPKASEVVRGVGSDGLVIESAADYGRMLRDYRVGLIAKRMAAERERGVG